MDGAVIGFARGGGRKFADRLTASPETLAFRDAHEQDTAHLGNHIPGTSAADRTEFAQVVLPHLDAAYNLARWLTRDPTLAEDVLQDAVLRALTYFSSLKGVNPRAWLLQIVRRTAYGSMKAQSRHAALTISTSEGDSPDAIAELPSGDADPEAMLMRSRDQVRVRKLIAALPDKLRETWVLRELEELSYKEIAEVTQTPIGTVMSRLWRARQMLVCSIAEPGQRR
jgi:RNA polymerase sigma-70 factor (ECF subfamily)